MQGSDGTSARRRGRTAVRAGAAVTAVAALLLAAACAGGGVFSPKAKPTPGMPLAQLTITPASGSRHVRPGDGIMVTAAHGKLTNVSVQTPGDPVTGSLSQGDTVWRSTWALNTSQRYTVTATAVNSVGKTATATSSFRTLTPQATFQTQIFEADGATYGVGMPIKLIFSQPITDKARVERALVLNTSNPVVGAWWWDGDESLDFRPKDFWPAGTTVSFIGHLDGVEGAPGVYGTADLTQTFHIGDALIVHVSTSRHRMTVSRNGVHLYTWPISTGRPGDDTPTGTFLTLDKGNPVRMKPADIKPGAPGYYNVLVYWSVRFTWSGDYIHAAPWSVGDQGFTNVSHGCVNLGPAYAEIYYKMEIPGDPVIVTGSPVHGAWDDGWTDWYLTWSDLLRRSAVHEAVVADSTGSSFVNPADLTTPSLSPTRPQAPPPTLAPAPSSSATY